MRQCAGFEMPRRDCLLTAVYRCVYTVHVGYIHYSRPCRARDAGAARAETRTAHRRTFDDRPKDERCRGIAIRRLRKRHLGHHYFKRKQRAHLRADHASGSRRPSWPEAGRGRPPSLHPRPGERFAHQRHHHQTGLRGAGGGRLHRHRAGQGFLVAGGNLELLREERLRQVEGHLARAVGQAENAGIEAADLHAMLRADVSAGRKLNEERT